MKPRGLWGYTWLKFDDETSNMLLKGMMKDVEESTTYQATLEKGRDEGRLEGEKRGLILSGTPRFGPPNVTTLTKLETITSQEAMERLFARLFAVGSWDELLK